MNQQQHDDAANAEDNADKTLTVDALRELTGGELAIDREEVRTEAGTWPSKSRTSARSYTTG